MLSRTFLTGLTYSVTILLSAFLLFWIQPLVSKLLLPVFGGTSSVWNVCLMYFQGMLLAGYAYAHYSRQWLGDHKQPRLHFCLLAVAITVLFSTDFTLTGSHSAYPPSVWLVLQLLRLTGISFLVLSAGAPLLQDWFSRTDHRDSFNPYFLYSYSNTGTVAALLLFPFLLEPLLTISQQITSWNVAFIFLCILYLFCYRFVTNNTVYNTGTAEDDSPVETHQKVQWFILSFLPSCLLQSVSRYVTTDIASVPLLWIIPLMLYMLTFILVFSRTTLIRHDWVIRLQPYLLFPPLAVIAGGTKSSFWIDYAAHLFAFFVNAMFCHGELARRKPHSSNATAFYLWIAAGGFAGGVFCAIAAPLLFDTTIEYPLFLIMMVALRIQWQKKTPFQFSSAQALILLVSLFTLSVLLVSKTLSFATDGGALALLFVASFFGTAVIRIMLASRPVQVAFILISAVGFTFVYPHNHSLYRSRGFYGPVEIMIDQSGTKKLLVMGTTIHGSQFLEESKANEPASYYARSGPFGMIFETFTTHSRNRSIAVMGLGNGSIAAYGEPEHHFTFYEINQQVIHIIKNTGYFTFIPNSKSTIDIIEGDARLMIQNAPDHSFDLIVMDAFSSDSVPIHILTNEAMELYDRKLNEGGLLAFQISNRYLKLEPALSNLARHCGYTGLICHDMDTGNGGRSESTWVVMAQSRENLGSLVANPQWNPLEEANRIPEWTDNYSNIIHVLRMPWDGTEFK